MLCRSLCRAFLARRRGATRLEDIRRWSLRRVRLKIDWTKPRLSAWPMGIDCRLDLGRGSERVRGGLRVGLPFVATSCLPIFLKSTKTIRALGCAESGSPWNDRTFI